MQQGKAFRVLDSPNKLGAGAHVIIADQKLWSPTTTDDLSAEERVRYHSFENKAAAQSFNHRRSLLRQVLSTVAGIPKHAISYEIGRFGKPRLAIELKNPIYFNISQGAGLCAIAIFRHADVGIDIEPDTSVEAMNDVCGVLHCDERAFVQSQDDKKSAFLDVWVQKEAVAKCFGFGFSRPAGSWSCFDELGQHRAERFKFEDHRICLCATREKPISFWRSDHRLAS